MENNNSGFEDSLISNFEEMEATSQTHSSFQFHYGHTHVCGNQSIIDLSWVSRLLVITMELGSIQSTLRDIVKLLTLAQQRKYRDPNCSFARSQIKALTHRRQ